MTPLSLIPPPWKIGAALALTGALVAAGVAYHDHVDQGGYDRAVAEQSARAAVAVLDKVRDNAAVAVKNGAINAFITKAKNEEIAPVVQRIYVDRVRVGAASCGPAGPAKTEDASGGDSTNPSGRLVREDVERDTRALTVAVEQDLATGRACQEFGRQHGFWPSPAALPPAPDIPDTEI